MLWILGWVYLWVSTLNASTPPRDYWVWGGIAPTPEMSAARRLYVLQGEWALPPKVFNAALKPQGLAAFPWHGPELVLTFRLSTLNSPKDLAQTALERANRWKNRGARVVGFQFDFDSPTARLKQYAQFLRELRTAIGHGWLLSVTGLADWSSSARPAELENLQGVVDEVVFQLYRGASPIANLDTYAASLRKLRLPYRVGLLPQMEIPASLTLSPNLRGVVTFLTKEAPKNRVLQNKTPTEPS